MNTELLSQLMSQLFVTALKVAGPLLLISLVTGVLVSVLQVVTQIQDASIAFVSKLVVVFFTLLFFGSWMLKSLVLFASTVINSIPMLF